MVAGVTSPALQFYNKTNADEGGGVSRPRREHVGLRSKVRRE